MKKAEREGGGRGERTTAVEKDTRTTVMEANVKRITHNCNRIHSTRYIHQPECTARNKEKLAGPN